LSPTLWNKEAFHSGQLDLAISRVNERIFIEAGQSGPPFLSPQARCYDFVMASEERVRDRAVDESPNFALGINFRRYICRSQYAIGQASLCTEQVQGYIRTVVVPAGVE